MARNQKPFQILDRQISVALGGAPTDLGLKLLVPGDGARVVRWGVISQTVGVGASSAAHQLTLEAGRSAAGVSIAEQITLIAEDAVGTTAIGDGLSTPTAAAVTQLAEGTRLQILTAESAAITTGAIVDVWVIWSL